MAKNPNKLEKHQREAAYRPQQQYDEEAGQRDDWARGYRYQDSPGNDRSGRNFTNPSGRDDPDRGYGQDSRYSQWSRGDQGGQRQFDSSGYGAQGRYSNHGYFGGSGAEYQGTRERNRDDDWRGYGNEYGYNAEGRDWSGSPSPYQPRYRQGEQTSREGMDGGGHSGGEPGYAGRRGMSSQGLPYRGSFEGNQWGDESGFGRDTRGGEYRGHSQFGGYGEQRGESEYRGQSQFGRGAYESPDGPRVGGAFGGGEGRSDGYGYESYGLSSSGRWGRESGVFQRGEHTGRGPRGYQRADNRVQEDVCERLAMYGQVDASDIDVSVSNGEVTLEGFVADRRQKRLAEDIIEDISGVKDVSNRLKVRGEGESTGSAASISGGARPSAGGSNGASDSARTSSS